MTVRLFCAEGFPSSSSCERNFNSCERNFNSFVRGCKRRKKEGQGNASLLPGEQIAMIGIGDHSSRALPLSAASLDVFGFSPCMGLSLSRVNFPRRCSLFGWVSARRFLSFLAWKILAWPR
jgi:hypothetical protein